MQLMTPPPVLHLLQQMSLHLILLLLLLPRLLLQPRLPLLRPLLLAFRNPLDLLQLLLLLLEVQLARALRLSVVVYGTLTPPLVFTLASTTLL